MTISFLSFRFRKSFHIAIAFDHVQKLDSPALKDKTEVLLGRPRMVRDHGFQSIRRILRPETTVQSACVNMATLYTSSAAELMTDAPDKKPM